jgi:predicted DNA-binding transcriptional regulator AlpA
MEVLTRREVLQYLKISPATLCAIINNRKSGLPPFPVIRVGRRQLFRKDAIEQWLLEVEKAQSCNEDRCKK